MMRGKTHREKIFSEKWFRLRNDFSCCLRKNETENRLEKKDMRSKKNEGTVSSSSIYVVQTYKRAYDKNRGRVYKTIGPHSLVFKMQSLLTY